MGLHSPLPRQIEDVLNHPRVTQQIQERHDHGLVPSANIPSPTPSNIMRAQLTLMAYGSLDEDALQPFSLESFQVAGPSLPTLYITSKLRLSETLFTSVHKSLKSQLSNNKHSYILRLLVMKGQITCPS